MDCKDQMLIVLANALPSANFGPLVHALEAKALTVVLAYAVTMLLSGFVVRYFVTPRQADKRDMAASSGGRFDAGTIIGKCENLMTVTFILLDEVTGLALIFAGKSLVRRKDIEYDPGYFLGGTLINFVWAMLIAMIARVVAFGV